MRKYLFLLSCATLSLHAQTTAVTTDGERVMLNADGTWKALDQPRDGPAVDTTCSTLIITGTEASGQPILSSQLILLSYDGGATGIGMQLAGAPDHRITTLRLTSAGVKNCLSKDTKVEIDYRDGTRDVIASDAIDNCKGVVPIGMGGSFARRDLKAALRTKEVRAIRVWLGDEFVERELSRSNSLTLMHSARCLMN